MPETPRLLLAVLSDEFAVCRLSAEDTIPAWAHHPGFCAITRTAEELSVVCPAKAVPAQVRAERDWRILKVAGPLDFALTRMPAERAERDHRGGPWDDDGGGCGPLGGQPREGRRHPLALREPAGLPRRDAQAAGAVLSALCELHPGRAGSGQHHVHYSSPVHAR